MIKIESYFLFNNTFVRVEEYSKPLPDDLNHVDGAITITIDSKEVLTFAHWDYVIVTWTFLVKLLLRPSLRQKHY